MIPYWLLPDSYPRPVVTLQEALAAADHLDAEVVAHDTLGGDDFAALDTLTEYVRQQHALLGGPSDDPGVPPSAR